MVWLACVSTHSLAYSKPQLVALANYEEFLRMYCGSSSLDFLAPENLR